MELNSSKHLRIDSMNAIVFSFVTSSISISATLALLSWERVRKEERKKKESYVEQMDNF